MSTTVGVWMTHYAAAGSNNERVLPTALASVLSQSYKDLTLYVFDNHSPGRSPEIFREAAAADSRVVIVDVPKGLAGIQMARFAWEYLNDKGHKYSITIGGHDIWNGPDFLAPLVKRMEAETEARKGNPEISIVYADTYQMDEEDQMTGRFQNIMQIGQVTRAFIPQYVLVGLDNPPFFGLWNESVRRNVPIRYECGGFDHMVVAHACLKGMMLYEPAAQLIMRRPPPGDGPEQYGKRHLSKEILAAGQTDFVNQLEWTISLVDEAIADAPPEPKATMRIMLISSMMSTYLTLRGTNLPHVPNAYAEFVNNPLVIEMMKGAHHMTRFADALVKSSKPLKEGVR
jgi:Glycosyl transferase family 2